MLVIPWNPLHCTTTMRSCFMILMSQWIWWCIQLWGHNSWLWCHRNHYNSWYVTKFIILHYHHEVMSQVVKLQWTLWWASTMRSQFAILWWHNGHYDAHYEVLSRIVTSQWPLWWINYEVILTVVASQNPSMMQAHYEVVIHDVMSQWTLKCMTMRL